MMANHRRQEVSAKLKKVYSQVSQAVRLYEANEGNFTEDFPFSFFHYNHGGGSYPNEGNWDDIFGKYLPVQVVNQTYTIPSSWNGSGHDVDNVLAMNDGTLIIEYNSAYGEGIDLVVDINGFRGPNKFGQDVFKLFIGENGMRNYTGTRENILDECKDRPDYCIELIKYDGWEIKNDYPYTI